MLTLNDPEILHRSEDMLDSRKAPHAEKTTRLAADVVTEMATGGD
jgi:hypothetical protein